MGSFARLRFLAVTIGTFYLANSENLESLNVNSSRRNGSETKIFPIILLPDEILNLTGTGAGIGNSFFPLLPIQSHNLDVVEEGKNDTNSVVEEGKDDTNKTLVQVVIVHNTMIQNNSSNIMSGQQLNASSLEHSGETGFHKALTMDLGTESNKSKPEPPLDSPSPSALQSDISSEENKDLVLQESQPLISTLIHDVLHQVKTVKVGSSVEPETETDMDSNDNMDQLENGNDDPESSNSKLKSSKNNLKGLNTADITLELNPNSSDLEFRHVNSTYKFGKQMPNFSAQIFTLSYNGVKKPVLIVQPEMSKNKNSNASNNKSNSKDKEINTNTSDDSLGGGDSAPASFGETTIPNFSIHFPLQTNSQFQIPRFNFTLPTLFLPGLIFTQNENTKTNKHEIHVSIPNFGGEPYGPLPVPTPGMTAEFELLPVHPESLSAHEAHEEDMEDNANLHSKDPVQNPSSSSSSNVNINGPETLGNQNENLSPSSAVPKPQDSDSKDKVPALVVSINPDKLNSLISSVNGSQEIQANGNKTVVTVDNGQAPIGKPGEHDKPGPSSTHSVSGTIPHRPQTIETIHSSFHGQLSPSAHLPTFPPPTGDKPSLGRPQFSTTGHNHKWNFPAFGQIYNKWFGTGAGRVEKGCAEGGNEDAGEGTHGDGDADEGTHGGGDAGEETHEGSELAEEENDATLCGSDGLCGVTCHRLGFYHGRCVDDSSCVCLLKSNPEFGLKLEYFANKRMRSWESIYPAHGLCHTSSCRINCEREGFVTGFCDSAACLCGLPWAEQRK